MKKQEIVFQKNKKKQPLIDVDQEHTQVTVDAPEDKQEIAVQSAKFEKLVHKTDRILLKVKAVFPFEFFPDSLVIDENKVNIIHRIFFWTSEIQSIPISHIQDVEVDTSILFATLKILPTGFSVVSYTENWVKINYLWRKDALKARRLIAGLLIASREGIDLNKVETTNFIEKVEELGTVK